MGAAATRRAEPARPHHSASFVSGADRNCGCPETKGPAPLMDGANPSASLGVRISPASYCAMVHLNLSDEDAHGPGVVIALLNKRTHTLFNPQLE